MSKKSSYLLGILLTIGLGMLLYNHFCCNCNGECEKKTTEPVVATTTNASIESIFALKGESLDYHCDGNFTFLKDNFKAITPVSDCVNDGITQLKPVLDKGEEHLTITGYCLSSEKNNSAFENLGLARANDVKNYFVSKGISSKSITTIGVVKDDEISEKDGTLYNSVAYELTKVEAAKTEDWNALKAKINANPLIMYFNTGQASIDLSVEDRKKVTDLVHYLDNVADAKLDVTGYTDNVGKVASNVKLGQERADFAKAYFVSNGILADRIISSSKGPESPIADNATAEGRAKNRRTEVKIN